jgi:hypothetical protein
MASKYFLVGKMWAKKRGCAGILGLFGEQPLELLALAIPAELTGDRAQLTLGDGGFVAAARQ